jgi:hypothetical protein
MITHETSPTKTRLLRTALFALTCSLGLVLSQSSVLRAADSASQPAPALPVTTAFEKVTGTENGPYLLKVTNVSKQDLTLSAKVQLSMPSHADRKSREVAAKSVAPGEVLTIDGLAAADKVTVTADGFAPLSLTVP